MAVSFGCVLKNSFAAERTIEGTNERTNQKQLTLGLLFARTLCYTTANENAKIDKIFFADFVNKKLTLLNV